jgi:hypothetical protein
VKLQLHASRSDAPCLCKEQSWSFFTPKAVPKLELGNQKKAGAFHTKCGSQAGAWEPEEEPEEITCTDKGSKP